MLWSSLSAAGCGAGSRSILFRVVTQQLLDPSCGKQTFCLWPLLLEAAGSGRSVSALATFGRTGTGIGVPGWGGMAPVPGWGGTAPVPDWDAFPK